MFLKMPKSNIYKKRIKMFKEVRTRHRYSMEKLM